MQIQPTQNYNQTKTNTQPQFKSVYPVRIWLREMGGGYAPVATKDLSKTLSTKIVNILNKSRVELNAKTKELENLKKQGGASSRTDMFITRIKISKWIKEFISKFDKDFAKQNKNYFEKPNTRAFCVDGGYYKNKLNPCSYLITGDDAKYFNTNFGKPIGLSIKLANGYKNTAEHEQACTDYWKKGFNYVLKKAKEFKINETPAELHIKMETVRTKTGTIKGYNINGIGFFPQSGPENPLELTEWLKR